jgi:D-alanyl-D-alanine carboxypeptidase
MTRSARPSFSTAGALLVTVAVLLVTLACTLTVEHEPASRDARRDLADQVDELARAFIDAGRTAGISVAVARDGRRTIAKGYGLADLENDVETTAATVYRIGSITKQFTAAGIMRLIEQDKLALDTDLATLLPDFPTEGHTVTVEQLLNHTSGIPSYTGLDEFWEVARLDLGHDELLALVNEPEFDFAPGAEFRYNNTGYYLLGMIIERIEGRDYATWVREELFEPLGLEATFYCGEREIIPHRAEGYERVDGELVNDEMLSMRLPYAAGALCSTVGDLIAWQRALAGGEVVSPASYEAMTTPRALADGSTLDYGFGLAVRELEGHRVIAHGGGINGFVSMLARYPDDGLDVVVLTNTGGPVAAELAEQVARAALGLEIPPTDGPTDGDQESDDGD